MCSSARDPLPISRSSATATGCVSFRAAWDSKKAANASMLHDFLSDYAKPEIVDCFASTRCLLGG